MIGPDPTLDPYDIAPVDPAQASEHLAVNPWVALAYLISGVFFILAIS